MKLLLIIPMALFELMLLAAGWALVWIHPAMAKRLMLWSLKTLPEKEWYS